MKLTVPMIDLILKSFEKILVEQSSIALDFVTSENIADWSRTNGDFIEHSLQNLKDSLKEFDL